MPPNIVSDSPIDGKENGGQRPPYPLRGNDTRGGAVLADLDGGQGQGGEGGGHEPEAYDDLRLAPAG